MVLVCARPVKRAFDGETPMNFDDLKKKHAARLASAAAEAERAEQEASSEFSQFSDALPSITETLVSAVNGAAAHLREMKLRAYVSQGSKIMDRGRNVRVNQCDTSIAELSFETAIIPTASGPRRVFISQVPIVFIAPMLAPYVEMYVRDPESGNEYVRCGKFSRREIANGDVSSSLASVVDKILNHDAVIAVK